MDPIIYLVVLFLLLMLLLPGLIFFIAYLAARSRKKKQKALLEKLGPLDFSATVRYNRGKTQNNFFKVKAFQGSGIIYVKDQKLFFEDTLNKNQHTFDLKTSNIKWEEINLINGFLKWFSVEDAQEKFYFNIETGMLIWNLDKKNLQL